MTPVKVTTTYIKGMLFESTDDQGKTVKMDALEANGGDNSAISPKKLLLAGLLGCTGMDVVSILRKMQVDYDSFDMSADADVRDEEPKIFTHIKMIYSFKGKDLPYDKIEKAVSLSQEKYCAVGAMLKMVCPVEYTITR